MSKNREYTGLVRTPSSMAWLIKQRSRISGKIKNLEKQHSELPEKIASLREHLASLDGVFPLHEVQVDPEIINPKRPYSEAVTPYGGMTRAIYECLRENKARGPLYTTEIAMHVARACNVTLASSSRNHLITRVGRRLKTLAAQGEVVRHHLIQNGNTEEGRWSLSP
ncbi:hypothetical protein [Hydrogenophaga sp.]|uniref:hypothetical protein n=1 Tax=Hydrogenophaga sp. TaxID=1904254 RepID=UPI00263737AE|nr:hypothetical protein [Hydrogenophaga sp.]